MVQEGYDLASRLQSFLDVFGMGGLLLVLCVTFIVIGVTFSRGLGLLLLTLFVSYTLGAVTSGGIIFLSTLARWGCLLLLGIGFFKYFTLPRPAFLLLIGYALLSFVFVFSSPAPMFAMQQSVLLLATIVCVSVAINSYMTSADKVAQLFKMGIVAATVWTISNLLLARGFTTSVYTRFSTDEAISGVVAAYSGAFFAPMVVWAIVQKESKVLRIYCLLLILPFLFVLLLTGVRSALFGMVGIALLPLLVFKVRPSKIVLSFLLIAGVSAVSVIAIYMIFPEKAQELLGRIFSISTTGRTERWALGLKWCLADVGFVGKGMGGANIIGHRDMGVSFHSSYLDIWGSTGIFGLLLVLMFLMIYLKKAIALVRCSMTEQTAVYARILMGYLIGIIAMGFVESLFASAGGIGICMLVLVAALIDRLRGLQPFSDPEGIMYKQGDYLYDEYSEHIGSEYYENYAYIEKSKK